MPYRVQDPSSKLDYSCQWSTFLDETSPSDTLATSIWSIDGGGSPDAVLSGELLSGTVTTVFVSGLEDGLVYRLSNFITTAQGRKDEQSFTIRCGQT